MNMFKLDLKWFVIHYNFNEINSDIKIILRSELHIIYDVIETDLNIVMIHMMYVWNLDQIYACLIVKHRSEN